MAAELGNAELHPLVSCSEQPYTFKVVTEGNTGEGDGSVQENYFHKNDAGVDNVEDFWNAFRNKHYASSDRQDECFDASEELRLSTRIWTTASTAHQGYLYVFEPIETVKLGLDTYCHNSHNIKSTAHIYIHPLTFSDSSVPPNNDDLNSSRYFYNHDPGNCGGSYTYESKEMSLDPGVYYIAVGLDLDDEENDKKKGENVNMDIQFDDHSLQDLNDGEEFTSDEFVISHNAIGTGDLASKLEQFRDFDEVGEFCKAAYGDDSWIGTHTDDYDDIPERYHCCGDDEDDSHIHNDLVCADGRWKENNAESYCEDNIRQSHSTPFFLEGSESITSHDINSLNDGSDGCCGDDAFICGHPYSDGSEGGDDCNQYSGDIDDWLGDEDSCEDNGCEYIPPNIEGDACLEYKCQGGEFDCGPNTCSCADYNNEEDCKTVEDNSGDYACSWECQDSTSCSTRDDPESFDECSVWGGYAVCRKPMEDASCDDYSSDIYSYELDTACQAMGCEAEVTAEGSFCSDYSCQTVQGTFVCDGFDDPYICEDVSGNPHTNSNPCSWECDEQTSCDDVDPQEAINHESCSVSLTCSEPSLDDYNQCEHPYINILEENCIRNLSVEECADLDMEECSSVEGCSVSETCKGIEPISNWICSYYSTEDCGGLCRVVSACVADNDQGIFQGESENRKIRPDICDDIGSEDCQENPACTLKQSAPVETTSSDHAYVSSDQQYFCNQDYSDKSGANNGITYADDGAWKWWSAEGLRHPFRIHAGLERDFVSNAESWFACDADNGYEGNAIESDEYEVLPPTDTDIAFDSLCPLRKADDVDESLPSFSLSQIEGWSNYVLTNENNFCEPLAELDEDELQGELEHYVEKFENELTEEDVSALAEEFMGCCYHPNAETTHDFEEFFEPSVSVSCDGFECRPLRDFETEDEDNGNPPASDDILKDEGFGHSYPRQTGLSCAEFGASFNQPSEPCDEVCVSLDPNLGFLVDARDGKCCFGGYCEESPGDQTCSELGGAGDSVVIPEGSEDFVCHGDIVDSADGDCCVGRWGYATSEDESEGETPAITCYEGLDGRPMYAECCHESQCYNIDTWSSLSRALGPDNGRVFGTGTQLHTVLSFDQASFGGYGNLTDYMRSITISDEEHESDVRLGAVPDLMKGTWKEDDVLAFDLRYQGPHKPRNLILRGNGDDADSSFELEDHLVLDRLIPNHWHHVEITFEEDLPDAEELYLYVKNVTPLREGDETRVVVDNVVLKPGGEDPMYCAGPANEWLEDLIVEEGSNLEETHAERFACNAQLSAGWTGTSCCGRTYEDEADVNPDETDFTRGEYFLDTEAACWGGVRVKDDTPVSRAYGNNPGYWSHLLYKKAGGEGKMWSCGEGSFEAPYEDDMSAYGIDENDDGTYTISQVGGSGSAQDLVVEEVDHFSILGHWYCDPSDQWKPLGDVARVKALASKLYGMAGDDYTLHCDYYDLEAQPLNSTSLAALGTPLGTPGDNATHACVLRNETDDGQRVYLALPLHQATDVNEFIASLYRTYYPLNGSDDPPDCALDGEGNTMPDDIILQGSSDDFFVECMGSDELHASYNKPLELLLLSIDEPPTQGFLASLWESVKGFFIDMFLGEGEGTSDAEPTTLPFQSIQGDYTYLYLSENGSKRVRGIMEHDENKEDWFVRVDYENLSGSVEPLVEGYRASGFTPSDAKRCSSGPNQTVFLSFKDDDAAGVDWRYLTSNIRLDGEGDPGNFASDSSCWLHNGRIDLDEECDDTYDQPYEIVAIADEYEGKEYCTNAQAIEKLCIDGELSDASCGIDSYRLYVTSDPYTGDLGGVMGADEKCRAAARQGSMGDDVITRAAQAVISDGTLGADSRFEDEVHVCSNVDVPCSKNDPFGSDTYVTDLFRKQGFSVGSGGRSFFYDEYGDLMSTAEFWTGSSSDGSTHSSGNHCDEWTSSSRDVYGVYGSSSYSVDGSWLFSSVDSCDDERHLHCLVPVGDSQ